MFDNMSQQKRIIIAVVLSMVFFIGYDFLIPKPVVTNTQQIQKQEVSNIQTKTQNIGDIKAIKTNNIIASVNNEHFDVQINENGEISSFILKDERFLNETNEAINLVDKNTTLYPLSMVFYDSEFNKEFNNTTFKANKSSVNIGEELVLSKDVNGVIVNKIITFKENGFYQVKITFSDNKLRDYVITPGERPNVLADTLTVHGAMIYKNDDTKVDYEDGDIKSNDERVETDSIIAAFSDRYYTSTFYNFEKPFKVVVKNHKDLSVGYVVASGNDTFNAYIGPKEHKILEAVNEKLTNVVEYGWFTFIAKPMFAFLSFIYSHVGNWGWSIVILTIVVRICLTYPTYKSMVSMQKLKVLAPKIKEIQEKYKGNPQKMQMHMMELYKKHKANPLGGCLPILIQIPIFFAIYRVLLNAIELKAAPWALWINDLAIHDPYYILPIYMGATMFLQQVITPMTIQDPTQAKIMKFLPLVFVIFFINFPAGLTLYWCVNNTFSLAQQWFVNKIFANKEGKNANS
ncbi:membrane protein insertase YidC [Campylobacter sp. RM12640]|uniref:membrane protein insertase YidC n=1 Tax=unclassified Campylobacter TaxID=2593542 RepID=UPI001BD9857A|nr:MULTISPECIES: membrane protein insertase YidC [unclassified Campylobacter]MBZ7977541.1 membrane protein insertase YidC [Campylobacter sp. RM12654]MBZ7979490.1 membrane protein insertase YidC [Campylobacter sp. RM12642]MBZ7982727.1 membrane protein insertase YidC [Campylobacter sp. RM12640]MBZ7988752.1 membrane protein insertase YidC [Campylobacter sp. RM12635]MBZ7992093.1 membrane protein insertase YidC [Campylobacter sp. RM9333]